eukprot:858297-Pelagomonas_calceolata.AAC.3
MGCSGVAAGQCFMLAALLHSQQQEHALFHPFFFIKYDGLPPQSRAPALATQQSSSSHMRDKAHMYPRILRPLLLF